MDEMKDRELEDRLDRWLRSVEPEVERSLTTIYRRGRRARALRRVAAVAAVLVFVAAVGWVASLMRSGNQAATSWVSVGSLESDGWTLSVPTSWQTTTITGCGTDNPVTDGIIVSSVPFQFLDPQGGAPSCEDRFVFDGFPSDGVALSIEPVGMLPGILPPESPTLFPLSSASLHRTQGIRGGPSMRYTGIYLADSTLAAFLRTWTGTDAGTESV